MKECKLSSELLPQYLTRDGLSLKEEMFVEQHLKICKNCRAEHEDLKTILESTRKADLQVDQVMKGIDWDKSRAGIIDKIEMEEQPVINIQYSASRWFSLRSGMAAASIFLVGILLGYLLFYSPHRAPQASFQGSVQSVDLIEKSFKENTMIHYLEQVRYYFLEIQENASLADISPDQNKALLSQTRYLQNSINNDYSLISTEELLKDIEFVLIEIEQILENGEESGPEFIRELISNKRLILKIHLTKKDLKSINNEV